MHFYTGDMFPAKYRNGAFIAFHGSRFEPDATGDLPGYNVVFLPFDGDLPAPGDFEVFADEFAGDARPLPDAAEYRPVGLAEGPDGALYISDDHAGRIWRVVTTD
jgi:glucose/arabinose dehydrogenase